MDWKQECCRALIKIWENVKQLYLFRNKLPKSKRLSSKSYNGVNETLDGPFFIANLHYFAYIFSLVETFLTKFQTQTCAIVNIEIIRDCRDTHCSWTLQKLTKNDNLSDNQKLTSVGKINSGFAVIDSISTLKKFNIVNVVQKQEFMKGMQQFVIERFKCVSEMSVGINISTGYKCTWLHLEKTF